MAGCASVDRRTAALPWVRLAAVVSIMLTSLTACEQGGGQAPSGTSGTSGPSGVAAPADQNWTTYGGNMSNWRYSSLTQVDTSNVKDLKGAWTFHVSYGEKASSFESTPVVVDGIMYVTSGR